MTAAIDDGDRPPLFLRLAGDRTRWRLLNELARSDRRVRELTELLNEPQNSVSYHLGRLRDGGLVSAHRSTADGRDSYYRIELRRCRALLTEAGAALHPALASTHPAARTGPRSIRSSRPVRVLFLCTGNSGRSQIAEALLAQAGDARVGVVSAGSDPKPMHPAAVTVMRDFGIDLTGRRSKPMSEFSARRFDYVITLCDRVREVRPAFPGRPETIHWSTPDPAAATGRSRTVKAFRATVAELQERIEFFTESALPAAG